MQKNLTIPVDLWSQKFMWLQNIRKISKKKVIKAARLKARRCGVRSKICQGEAPPPPPVQLGLRETSM